MAEKGNGTGMIRIEGCYAVVQFSRCGWSRKSFLVRRGMRKLWETGEHEMVCAGEEIFP